MSTLLLLVGDQGQSYRKRRLHTRPYSDVSCCDKPYDRPRFNKRLRADDGSQQLGGASRGRQWRHFTYLSASIKPQSWHDAAYRFHGDPCHDRARWHRVGQGPTLSSPLSPMLLDASRPYAGIPILEFLRFDASRISVRCVRHQRGLHKSCNINTAISNNNNSKRLDVVVGYNVRLTSGM